MKSLPIGISYLRMMKSSTSNEPVRDMAEAVAYQNSFEGDFKRIMFEQRALYNLHISPVKGFKGDKLARLRGVLGLYEHRKVIWNKWRKWDILEEELLTSATQLTTML